MRHIAGDLVWYEQYVTKAKELPPKGTGTSLRNGANGTPIYSDIVYTYSIEHVFANLMLRSKYDSFEPGLQSLRSANKALDVSKKITLNVETPLQCEA